MKELPHRSLPIDKLVSWRSTDSKQSMNKLAFGEFDIGNTRRYSHRKTKSLIARLEWRYGGRAHWPRHSVYSLAYKWLSWPGHRTSCAKSKMARNRHRMVVPSRLAITCR